MLSRRFNLVTNAIKVLATIVILSALGLELANLRELDLSWIPQQWFTILIIFGRLALISHGIEAAIAALSAASRNQSPLKYGFYTFFVGTVGLVELFQMPPSPKTSQT